jgi:adenosylhomocysteine nucleosidase
MTNLGGDAAVGTIGVLCALPEELLLLAGALEHRRSVAAPPLEASLGRLDGQPVVIAEAGVGKTNAASTATILMERFECSALVLSGVAGGVSDALDVGDIVVARRVVDVDYGRVTDEGRIAYQPGTLPFADVAPDAGYDMPTGLQADIEAALSRLETEMNEGAGDGPQVRFGTIASGDTFVASPRYRDELAQRWSASAVEMEGAAVCGVAERYGRPWLIVRALSDRAGEDSSLDFETFITEAAAASARVVRALLPLLGRYAAPLVRPSA